jgi:hypothetical protein
VKSADTQTPNRFIRFGVFMVGGKIQIVVVFNVVLKVVRNVLEECAVSMNLK